MPSRASASCPGLTQPEIRTPAQNELEERHARRTACGYLFRLGYRSKVVYPRTDPTFRRCKP